MSNLYGNKNGKKVFRIPVEWVVYDVVDIKADSIEEAVKFFVEHLDDIPLGTEPSYVEGTYKITGVCEDSIYDVDANLEAINNCLYDEREADDEFDRVVEP